MVEINVISNDNTTAELQIATVFYHRDGFQCSEYISCTRINCSLNERHNQVKEYDMININADGGFWFIHHVYRRFDLNHRHKEPSG
jgi:hypothetical protein